MTNELKVLALALTGALLLSGCGGSESQQPVSPLAGPFSQRTVHAVEDLLAASGATIVAAPADTQPLTTVHGQPSPLRVWAWQARNLAAETASGGGLPGSLIDQLAPMPEGVLPASYLLAGYISGVSTPGARALRLYMGDQDWRHPDRILFPTLALGVLVSDVTSPAHAGAGAAVSATPTVFHERTAQPAPLPEIRLVNAASAPCSAVSGLVDGTLNAVFNTINDIAQATLPPLLATAVSIGLGLAKGAIKGLLGILVAPVVKAITAAVALLTAAFEVVSVLKPWTLTMRALPSQNSYSNNAGTITIDVQDDTPFDWPPQLQDCARTITGQELPTLQGVPNAPVAWSVNQSADTSPQASWLARDGVTTINQTSLDTATRKDRTATLAYTTGSEPPACSGAPIVTGAFLVRAEVTRIDAQHVQEVATSLLGAALSLIPSIIRGLFSGLTSSIAARITDTLGELAGHDIDFATLLVDRHDEYVCATPPSSPTSSPSASASPSASFLPFPNACRLITAGDVDSVMGGGGGRQQYFPPKNPGDGSGCLYTPTSIDWQIAWSLVGIDVIPANAITPLIVQGYVPLPGLGDAAYIHVLAGGEAAWLVVQSGSTVLKLTVSLGDPVAQSTVEQLARIAIGHL